MEQENNADKKTSDTQQKITWEYAKQVLSNPEEYKALPPARQKELAEWLATHRK